MLRVGVSRPRGGLRRRQWFDDRLKLSADLFESDFGIYPRFKVAAAFELFSHLYVLGGVDDVFNEPVTYSFVGDALVEGVPHTFEEVRFGRDWFVGGMVRFNDLDLTALLTIGSGILLAAAD